MCVFCLFVLFFVGFFLSVTRTPNKIVVCVFCFLFFKFISFFMFFFASFLLYTLVPNFLLLLFHSAKDLCI